MSICKQNGAECKTSIGSNSNNQRSFRRCMHCSSKSSNSGCVDNLDANNIITCTQYNDDCFTHIGRDHVLRGCASEQTNAFMEKCHDNKDKCEICTTKDDNDDTVCNSKPLDSMEMCIECSSQTEQDCHNNPDLYKDKICSGLDSAESEGCYTHLVCFFFF